MMNLELNVDEFAPAAKRGRKGKNIVMESRALTKDEAVFAAENSAQGIPSIKRLSGRHHMLAKLLASGTSAGDAALITRYDPSRVSILQNDPAFQELLRFYRDEASEAYAELHEHIAGMSMDAILELRQRFESDPDEFTKAELLEIFTRTADRSGHGPSSKSEVNVNVGIADRLAAGRKRVEEMRTIEHE